jgi:5-methylcytosine-specific restriction endonuclease McrA
MTMTTQDRALLWQRTQEWFDALKRQARAAGTCPAFRLDELVALVERHLTRPTCPYCRGTFTVATMALGHPTPIARGGRFSLRNVEVCCHDCHLLRGPLDAQEYRELRLLLATWPRPIQKRFLAGLQAVQALSQPPLPPVGSLEWFTGADEPHAPKSSDPRGYQSTLQGEAPRHEMSHR